MIWVRLILIAMVLTALLPLQALAKAEGRYASIIVDADSLEVLHARQIDATRHPASLTKIMTLYLTFEALDRGELSLDSQVKVSAHAARTAPFKMGLKRGQTISIDTLIQAVAVRSANDAAVVLAEAIAGSEEAFVEHMNRTAAILGMQGTQFRNPHGLPDDLQLTTARDMAKLALATMTQYPQHYHYFGQSHFRGQANTNGLLRERDDVDGFKTGFTRASGYNLVISAARNDRRIIAIVLGGASSGARNSHMSDLIDRGFEVIETAPPALIAASTSTPAADAPRNWALQIDGFMSSAETAILADQLVRTAGRGQMVPRAMTANNQTWHSIRIEQLDHATARQLCSDHASLLQIPARRCKVLSIAKPG